MLNPLSNYQILVADADQRLSDVFIATLHGMGFTNVQWTASGKESLSLLKEKHFDFLITDWNTRDMDGISLIDEIRHDPSPNIAIPILMLSGRAEEADIATARDHGINEYVAKPFSAKTVYDRIERVIEKPRPFIVSRAFIGPNRRRRAAAPPAAGANRRKLNIPLQERPAVQYGNLIGEIPKLWSPDFSLKAKLPHNRQLQSFITADTLEKAQAKIHSFASEYTHWLKEDVTALRQLYQEMPEGSIPAPLMHRISELSLAINAHAGTFGYGLASKVAYALYLFCHAQPNDGGSARTVIQKHIEVLHAALSAGPRDISGRQGEQVLMELHNLAIKLGTAH